MSFMQYDPLTLLCYGFLYLTVLALWAPLRFKPALWIVAFGMAGIFGLLSHHVDILGIGLIIMLGFFFTFSRATSALVRGVFSFLALILSVALVMHLAPGFHNLRVLDQVYLSANGSAFSLYLNFDKTAVGILIVGMTLPIISNSKEWKVMFKEMLPRAILVIAILAVMSVLLGFVEFDLKISDNLWIWIPTNLLFVCLAEEAFFRGFIQKNLTHIFSNVKLGNYVAIGITAILFGLAHYMGGIKYMALATIAGVGYGWIYQRTRRIEASILTHFGLNLMHVLFFTYPALKSAF